MVVLHIGLIKSSDTFQRVLDGFLILLKGLKCLACRKSDLGEQLSGFVNDIGDRLPHKSEGRGLIHM